MLLQAFVDSQKPPGSAGSSWGGFIGGRTGHGDVSYVGRGKVRGRIRLFLSPTASLYSQVPPYSDLRTQGLELRKLSSHVPHQGSWHPLSSWGHVLVDFLGNNDTVTNSRLYWVLTLCWTLGGVGVGSRVDCLGQLPALPLTSSVHWENHLPSQCLSFLICKMRIITLLTS